MRRCAVSSDLFAPLRAVIERLEAERDEYRADNEWLERENARLRRRVEELEGKERAA